jgi:hypothetical protein
MPTIAQSPQDDFERKFESLINALKSVIERSKNQSDEFYSNVNSLYGFQPKADQEMEGKSPTMRISGIITDIGDLILELDRINNRNRDILDQFGKLV